MGNNKYDKRGYDINGFDKNGFNKNGLHRLTKTIYNKEGVDRYGLKKKLYNEKGYDSNGFNKQGFDKFGFDEFGFNKEGYDKNGYDKLGFNKSGFNKEEYHKITKTLYDLNGFDINGFNINGFNKKGEHLSSNYRVTPISLDNETTSQRINNNIIYDMSKEATEKNLNIDVNYIPTTSKPESKIIEGQRRWNRDPQLVKLAIAKANYSCECDKNHKTFISKVTFKQYMEAHHLIPMNEQDNFKKNLDVLGNLVSLCPTCHRLLHHGIIEEKEDLLKLLYIKKESELRKHNINITFEKLKSFYL